MTLRLVLGSLVLLLACTSSPAAETAAVADPTEPPPAASPPELTTDQLQLQPPEAPPPERVRFSSPGEAMLVTDRRPRLTVDFLVPLDPASVLLVLDGVDVTQLATVTPQGVIYAPLMVVPAGQHTLVISAVGQDGSEIQQSYSFSTRHGEVLQEAYSRNELTATHETALARVHSSSFPTTKLDANLRSEMRLATDSVQFDFTTNVRYFDQNQPVFAPQRKGFDMMNYLATLGYAKDQLKVKGSVGDQQISETPYTVYNYARRGVQAGIEYGDAYVRAFNVSSEQVLGLRGSMFSRFNPNGDLRGVAGGLRLLENRVEIRAVHATGGETGSSYNIGTTQGGKRGDVSGVLLVTDFFENRFRTEFEGAVSRFDSDTDDEFGKKNGTAYRIKAGGFLQPVMYDLQYERVNAGFTSVGNMMGVMKDKETWTARTGVTIDVHSFNASLMRQIDNLDLNPALARTESYQGAFDYNLSAFPAVPIGLSYQKGVTHSSHEPATTDPETGLETGPLYKMGIQNDTIMGRVGYNHAPFAVMAMVSHSWQNDTESNNDSKLITYSLAPSYNLQNLNIMSNIQLMQNKSDAADVRTDTFLYTLDIRSRWLQDTVTFDVGGTYSQTTNTTDTTDLWNVMGNMRLGYNLPPLFKGFLRPAIALRGAYSHSTDRIASTNRDEASIFLLLATAMPFVF